MLQNNHLILITLHFEDFPDPDATLKEVESILDECCVGNRDRNIERKKGLWRIKITPHRELPEDIRKSMFGKLTLLIN